MSQNLSSAAVVIGSLRVNVNVLKLLTLFSPRSKIKCWLSGLEFLKMHGRIANREDPDQTASASKSSLIWVCTVCLDLFVAS